MRRLIRWLVPSALLLAIIGGGLGYAVGGGTARAANTPHVYIIDNDAPFNEISEGTAQFGYAPNNLVVTQGESVVFDSPSTNHYPHTVTSITFSGRFPNVTAEFGTKFNSSDSFQTAIGRGGSWTLDTSSLDPGHYMYYCWIHPWMTGMVTVVAP